MNNVIFFGMICLIMNGCMATKKKILPYIENFYGVKVIDEYHSHENLNDPSVLNYLLNEDRFSEKYFDGFNNISEIKGIVKKFNYETEYEIKNLKMATESNWFSLKKLSSDSLFSLVGYNSVLNQEELLFSNNEGRIQDIYPSPNGKYVVIAFSYADGEFAKLKIFDVKNRNFYPNELKNARPKFGSINWIDNKQFSFQYFPNLDTNSPNYLHNSKVKVVKLKPDEYLFSSRIFFSCDSVDDISPENRVYMTPAIEGNRYVTVVVGDDYYTNSYISKQGNKWIPFWTSFDRINSYRLIDRLIYFTKYNDNDKLALYVTTLDNPDFDDSEFIIEEGNWVLKDFVVTSNGIYLTKVYNGVKTEIAYIDNNGVIHDIELPESTGRILLSSKSWNSPYIWIRVDSWVSSNDVYIFDSNTGNMKSYITKNDNIDINSYKINETEIKSFDSELLPVSIIYKKDTDIFSRTAPILLTGYGAFGTSLRPYKYKFLLPWIEEGGVYAVAHVRGGGEKGKEWREAGKRTLKYNTWMDFIAATEYLVNSKIADPNKIVTWASSAGAICSARALIERPELYTGAIILNGQLNSLRGEFEPGGKSGINEYGSVKTKEGFEGLMSMDSYHNLKSDVDYPPVYLRASLDDTRVPAYHSSKFHARLNRLSTERKSILDILPEGGHGFALTQDERIEETVRMLAFAFAQIQHPTYFSSSD